MFYLLPFKFEVVDCFILSNISVSFRNARMEQNEKIFWETHVAKPTPPRDDYQAEPKKIPEPTNQINAATDSW